MKREREREKNRAATTTSSDPTFNVQAFRVANTSQKLDEAGKKIVGERNIMYGRLFFPFPNSV